MSDSIFYRVPGERFALGWVGHRASDEITGMLNVSRAKNWEEFKAAISGFAVPGQNMIFAGSAGDIGHALAAWVPKDAQDTPDDLITRAGSARSDFHTAESLPSWHDPPAGFVVSANNRPDTKLAIGRLFSSPDRAARITALLRNTSTIDFPLLAGVQRDVQADSAKKLAARLAQIAKAGSSRALAPRLGRIASLLEGWSGEYEAESQAPAAFEILLFHFCRLYYPRSVLSAYSAAWALRDLIRSDIETADETTIRPVVLKALKRTARSLRSRTWSQLHRLRIDHPLGLLPLAGRRYRYFDFPASGGSETVMKTANGLKGGRHAVRFGSNARHISKLSDSDENYFVLLGGQDGWFGSTTFADQVSLWREGKYIQVPLQLETVRSSFPYLTEISPAPKTGPSTASKQSGGL